MTGMDSPPPTAAAEADKGDFYVEPDCCLLCGVPEAIAPEIFHTGEKHCVVKRQPKSQDEIDRTIRAMASSEVDCIRYQGRDPVMLTRIAQAGMADQADNAAASVAPILRDRVRFVVTTRSTLPGSAILLAAAYRAKARARGNDVLPAWLGRSTVWLSWFQKQFHRIRFAETGQAQSFSADLRAGSALGSLSWSLDDWLRENGAEDIRWQTAGDDASERSTPM